MSNVIDKPKTSEDSCTNLYRIQFPGNFYSYTLDKDPLSNWPNKLYISSFIKEAYLSYYSNYLVNFDSKSENFDKLAKCIIVDKDSFKRFLEICYPENYEIFVDKNMYVLKSISVRNSIIIIYRNSIFYKVFFLKKQLLI
jgi:hypothetical protein